MKQRKKRRYVCLAAALALTYVFALPTAALTPMRPISGAYKASTYHQNLLNIPRTGDEAFDAVAIAMSQVGYHEGNGTAELDGKNQSGTKNYTEYNRTLGKIDGTYGYAWCAAFVSWCLAEANAADAAGGAFASCSLWLEALRNSGQYSSRASGYSPKEGDLIFFRSAGAGRASDHVGLVRYVENGRVYTVEGNSSNKVSLNSYALSSTYIVGYGKPQYGENLIPSAGFLFEDKESGWYIITNDFVNVRKGAGTSYAKSGKLYLGDTVRIFEIKNGWGAFMTAGEVRYISLDYASFVSPLSYRVSYNANGGENAPAAFSYFSIERKNADAEPPIREGYSFLYWQDASGKQYAEGDPLPAADLTLTAVWELLPAVETPPIEEPPLVNEPSAEAPPHGDTPPTGDTSQDFLQSGTAEPSAPWSAPAEKPRTKAPDIATAITVLLLSVGGVFAYVWRKKRQT